jgi:microcystin-dependent protein
MNPFIGEIRMVGFQFAPVGWAQCAGQLMSISQNTALFSILGTIYGGDGRSTFALPNFQAAAPVGAGNGQGLSSRTQGETGGESSVTLLQSTMPTHNHNANCIKGGGSMVSPNVPQNTVWASDGESRAGANLFTNQITAVTMNPLAIQMQGGTLPHNNLSPYLTVYFIIALQGIYPTRG